MSLADFFFLEISFKNLIKGNFHFSQNSLYHSYSKYSISALWRALRFFFFTWKITYAIPNFVEGFKGTGPRIQFS